MEKKTSKEKKNLALSLFGDNPPTVKVVLDKDAPQESRDKYERMNSGDTNCACE